MSARPTGPDSGLQRLVDEGYEIEVRQQHLLVHSIPYVTGERAVKRSAMVCTFIENAGTVLPPDNHQVWWSGEYPCFASGAPITQIENEHNRQDLFKGCPIQHRFSNKPDGVTAFPDHYSKVVHYITIIQAQAKAIDPTADARTGRVISTEDDQSVFRYADTASARSEIMITSARMALGKVAIIGLGGTGSYVLDQVAKTPVAEIHLFDGDEFLQHNAFRSPGAATLAELEQRMPKVEYFRQRYDPMRRGIACHPYYLNESNLADLLGFDFVFVCVDRGKVRAMLCRHLQAQGTPFVDVGMSIEMVKDTLKLVGTCRFTLSTPTKADHLGRYVPVDDDEDDVIYRQNIQVADMNALNAQLAVMKWKQHFGFYQDDFQAHNGTFSVNSQSLTRDEMTAVTMAAL